MAKHRHLIDTTKLDRDWVEGEVFSLCDKIRIQSDFEPARKGDRCIAFSMSRVFSPELPLNRRLD